MFDYVRMAKLLSISFLLFFCFAIGAGQGYRLGARVSAEKLESYKAAQAAQAAESLEILIEAAYFSENYFLDSVEKIDNEQFNIPSSDACGLSANFISVWNRAAGTTDELQTVEDASTTKSVTASEVSTAASISQADLTTWFIEYSRYARTVEAQLRALIKYEKERSQNLKK